MTLGRPPTLNERKEKMITTGKYFHSHTTLDLNTIDKAELREEIAAIVALGREIEEGVRVRSFDDLARDVYAKWNTPRAPASERD